MFKKAAEWWYGITPPAPPIAPWGRELGSAPLSGKPIDGIRMRSGAVKVLKDASEWQALMYVSTTLSLNRRVSESGPVYTLTTT